MIHSLKKLLDDETHGDQVPMLTEKKNIIFEALCEILKELVAIEKTIMEQTDLLRNQFSR